uniref:CTCK domain-containing protein n=1 Tax=Cyprinus carpio TaxID=7962 RepID=A0A8C1IL13_CYPCA
LHYTFQNSTVLVSNGCISSTPVEITSCSGLCETSSIRKLYQTFSSLCVETDSLQKRTHSYIYIESCGCKASVCSGQSTSLRRRRRRL